MRKFAKRFLAITLIAILTLGCFAGCVTEERPEVTLATKNDDGLYTTDPVTLTVMVNRHPEARTSADEIWYFKYMEYWFKQKGYDVTINVQDTNSKQQVMLTLDTNTMPDIVWSHSLNTA